MTEAEIEVERPRALDRISEYLRILEPTLTKEQIALCPIDAAKWWKHPEWSERDARLQTEEGRAAEAMREQLLNEWAKSVAWRKGT